VLCDVYAGGFLPLSDELCPVLVPLAGGPILAYTLESLERGGIEEVIVVCSLHTSQVQKYIDSSRWGEKNGPVKVKVVGAAAATSVGDALRELDRLGLVRADFILVRGGILTTLPLSSLVEEHRKRKADDKNVLLMTMVLMQNESQTAFGRRYDSFLSCC